MQMKSLWELQWWSWTEFLRRSEGFLGFSFFLFLFFSGRGEGKYKKKSKYLVKLSMRTPALYAGLLLEVKVLYRSVLSLQQSQWQPKSQVVTSHCTIDSSRKQKKLAVLVQAPSSPGWSVVRTPVWVGGEGPESGCGSGDRGGMCFVLLCLGLSLWVMGITILLSMIVHSQTGYYVSFKTARTKIVRTMTIKVVEVVLQSRAKVRSCCLTDTTRANI